MGESGFITCEKALSSCNYSDRTVSFLAGRNHRNQITRAYY
jgi:hypothetical protein